MPGERRVTRSSKDTSSTNGASKSGSGKKEAAPAKSTPSKAKVPAKEPPKKGSSSKETATKANGVNGGKSTQEDIEMAEEAVKSRKEDDEMTVVVPPPKGGKLVGGNDEDEAMEGVEGTDEEATEGLNPVEKTIAGKSCGHFTKDHFLTVHLQAFRTTSCSSSVLLRSSTLVLLSVFCAQSLPTASICLRT